MSETLVVGRDATTRALLCAAFARQGLRARAAQDAVAALALARSAPPDALVAEPELDGVDAFALLKALRADAALSALPVLFLGGEEDERRRAINEGADAVLPLPAFARDVVSLVRFLCTRPRGYTIALEGYGVLSFVRALAAAQIDGQLYVKRAPPARLGEGAVALSGGAVLSCRLGHLRGRPALNRLAIWPRASVSWRLGRAAAEPGEALDEGAFVEAATYLAEIQAHLRAMPPEELALSIDAARRPPPSALPGEVNAILTLAEGGRSLGDLIEEAPFRVLDTLRILRRLFEMGLLRGPAQPAPLPPDEALLEPAAPADRPAAPQPVVARKIVIVGDPRNGAAADVDEAAQTWPPGRALPRGLPAPAASRPPRPPAEVLTDPAALAALEAGLERALSDEGGPGDEDDETLAGLGPGAVGADFFQTGDEDDADPDPPSGARRRFRFWRRAR